MAKIRVLVVDDAVVIRKILTDAISEDPDLEVVGTAANGKIALQKVPQVNPDLITLDVEMPELNGIETLKVLKAQYPKIPVIMFSTLTERGAKTTLEALSIGAADYVTKPANVGGVSEAKTVIRASLVQKIKALVPTIGAVKADLKVPSNPATILTSMPRSKQLAPVSNNLTAGNPVRVIAIGVSTGGPNALAKILPTLPSQFPVPVVLVQHMPPMFTRLLAERLNAQCQLKVVEAQADMPLEAGTVYIAPGDYHLEVVRRAGALYTQLTQAPPENSCRPAVDVLFRSVAKCFGGDCLAVILTGMGKDGLHGVQVLKDHGAHVLVQDEQTSIVWGMPGYVAEAGLADAILPLEQIGPALTKIATESTSPKSASFGVVRP